LTCHLYVSGLRATAWDSILPARNCHELKTVSPHKEAKTSDIKSVGLLVVTLVELLTCDGKDGKKSYVAV
jgi:hypothetical protein